MMINFPVWKLDYLCTLEIFCKLQVHSQCDALKSELQRTNKYVKYLEDALKLKDQGDDVTDQTQAQERIMMIIGNEQNDEEISKVFLYSTLASYCLGIIQYPHKIIEYLFDVCKYVATYVDCYCIMEGFKNDTNLAAVIASYLCDSYSLSVEFNTPCAFFIH